MPVTTNDKLLFACWATVIVLAIMAIVFIRSRRLKFMWAVGPLTLPPAMYIVSGVIARAVDPASSVQIRIILDLAAALVACLLIGFAASIVSKARRTRVAYLVCALLFVMTFSAFLIMNSVSQMNLPAV